MDELKEKGLLPQDTHKEVQKIEIKSLEDIDDDDIASLSSEFKTCADEICRALTDCEPIDDGLSSYNSPCNFEEEIADYALGNNIFSKLMIKTSTKLQAVVKPTMIPTNKSKLLSKP